MTEYITNSDYEFAWTMEGIKKKDNWDLYECKHCGMYCSKEPMLEHLNRKHWWVHHPERIVYP